MGWQEGVIVLRMIIIFINDTVSSQKKKKENVKKGKNKNIK